MGAPVVITFQARDYSANNGKIDVSCTVDSGDLHQYDFYIGVVSPVGETLKAFSASTADKENLVGGNKSSVLVPIPVDEDDDYLGGTYLFTIKVVNKNNGDTATWTDLPFLFVPKVYDSDNLTGALEVTAGMNCLTGVLTAQDLNDYDGQGITLNDRDITITPPSVDPQSAATSTTSSVTIEPAYTNVDYDVLLEIDITWDEETLQAAVDTVGPVTCKNQGTLNLYKTVSVSCEEGGICGSLSCIQAEMDEAYTKSCSAGGFANLSKTEKDNLTWSVLNMLVAKASFDCGQVAKSLTYISRAKEGLDCSCGCDGTDSSADPKPYTPPTS